MIFALHLCRTKKTKMKSIYTTLILLIIATSNFAQTALQHQAPPTNNFPYTRGMFVDCTDDIIRDIRNGNSYSLDVLKTYIRENFINYIAVYDLDHGKVIGNPTMEPAFKVFLTKLKKEFPTLQIGIIGQKTGYNSRTKNLKVADFFSSACFSSAAPYSRIQLDSLINDVRNNDDLQRSETIKFFLRGVKFTNSMQQPGPGNCNSMIDVFYLEDQYWKDISNGNLVSAKAKFESYKSVLQFLQMLKCNCRNFTVEAEFEPSDYFRLAGWTATDQIEQADPLIDKMMIPFYTSPYNASGAFDINCRLLHLLSDQFSKNGTRFYTGFSAQSNSFYYCNSSTTPLEHLGRYLSGIIPMASGNMYSVEQLFLDKLNDPAYMCAGCSCYEYQENQYSISNPTANMCTGSMWYTYSMLKNNGLFRTGNSIDENELVMNPDGQNINLKLISNHPFSFELFDVQGRAVKSEMKNAIDQILDISDLSNGIYILSVKSTDGKQFSRRIPVLHR